MHRTVTSPRRIRGDLAVPGDKSIAHRALIFNAMARGVATVRGVPESDDLRATIRCLQAIGASIEQVAPGTYRVTCGAIRAPSRELDASESGTTMRLMAGLLAAQPFESVITGAPGLRHRPMDRIAEPLRQMGATITGVDGDKAPLSIRGGNLRGIRYRLPVASAQVKSAILIAGASATGETVVEESEATRDHTERLFRAMGLEVTTRDRVITLRSGPLKAIDVDVPGDISSAAYWLVAGALHPDAEIVVRGVGINPTRTGILDALAEMGAQIALEHRHEVGGEPVADIRVRSSSLRGIRIGGAIIPRLIDELPLLALAGALAEGRTEIRDAAELRVKESDRVAAVAGELRKLGVKVDERPDGMVVHGGATLRGAICDSHGDHRVAMTLAIAGLIASGKTTIEKAEAVEKSYPIFWKHLERLVTPPPPSGTKREIRRSQAG